MSASTHHTHTNLYSHSNSTRSGTRVPSNPSSLGGSSSWRHDRWANSEPTDDDMEQLFSSDMRDRQARGKDPYLDDYEFSEQSSGARGAPGMGIGMRMRMTGGVRGCGGVTPPTRNLKEPFQKIERRDWAETVLDNPELLLMYAQSNGDTLPATRLRFKRIMCGLEDEDDDGEIATIPDLSRGGQYQQQPYQTQQPQKSGRGGSSSNGSRSGR